MTEASKILNDASARLYELICAGLKTERGVHLETAITAAGTLAGYELQRASNIDFSQMTPGTPVFNVPGVDQLGPQVLDFIVQACRNSGITEPPPADLSVPPGHAPQQSYLELMQLFAPPYRALIDSLAVEPHMRWIVAAQACVRLILAGQQTLRPAISQALAMEAVVAGSKTVPPVVS